MAPQVQEVQMSTGPGLTVAQKAEIWVRRSRGEPIWMIARHIGRKRGTVHGYVRRSGGVPPRMPQRSRRELTMREREELSRGLAAGESCRAMARRLARSASSVSREV